MRVPSFKKLYVGCSAHENNKLTIKFKHATFYLEGANFAFGVGKKTAKIIYKDLKKRYAKNDFWGCGPNVMFAIDFFLGKEEE